jgi:hypothetical protein
MTVTTEQPILAAVKASIQALTPATPAKAASVVMVYPDDYSTAQRSLPFVVVRLAYGPHTTVPKGMQSAWRQGRVIIEVYTAEGAIEVPSTAHAASELKKRQWWKAIATWLMSDRTLTDTVIQIGDGSVLFTDERAYMQWNQKEYDGLYITVPFSQKEC